MVEQENNPSTISLEDLRESSDFEAKKAQGKSGTGELPKEFFPTYSAMCNSEGGIIVLGVEELIDGTLIPSGIIEVDKVIKTLWDGINNKQQVSANLLQNSDVVVQELSGKKIIVVRVPRAQRRSRPVYVGSNPLTGTYRRNHSGDYRCDDDVVKRMLADQLEESTDSKVLDKFGVEDLDPNSVKSYRQLFSSHKPDHPWNSLSDLEFLRSIGAYGRNRNENYEGLTGAGLLMLGKYQSIREVFPNYFVDYQERDTGKTEVRWIDRITPDGTWSGNLFEFYRLVINKLFQGLKVPFSLKSDLRVDQTPVHEALREALVNTVVHADFLGTISILVVKCPDMYEFRNPGTMRVSIDDAIKGGVSDSRNKTLQQLFRYVGIGEQAGSGFPKIYSAWKNQSWRVPDLVEYVEPPDQTILEMRMVSLLPTDTIESLTKLFGERFSTLSEVQRLALATALLESKVTHSRLKQMVSDHPTDISKQLAALVRDGYLIPSGASRGTIYKLALSEAQSVPIQHSLVDEAESIQHKGESIQHSNKTIQHKLPDVLEGTPIWITAQEVALTVSKKARAENTTEVETAILNIARLGYVSLRDLAKLLSRDAQTLQNHYLNGMLKDGKLLLKYPNTRRHPNQAYTSAT
jgi:predicted HTH transcriptional regulator